MFKIFVGNLNATTTAEAVRRLFARHAEVDDVALPVDPETGKSRGFAIVMIKDELRAKGAMIALRGTRLDGRALVINQARKKGQAPPPKRERRGRFRLRAGHRPSSGGGGGYGGGRESRGQGGRTGGYGGGQSGRPGGSRPDWRSGGGNRPSDRGGPGGPPRPPRDDED